MPRYVAFLRGVSPMNASMPALKACFEGAGFTDPHAAFELPANAKLVLPIEFDDARILAMTDRDVFTAYVPGPRGPVFMTLLEKTFGKGLTTRTGDTVRKCAAA